MMVPAGTPPAIFEAIAVAVKAVSTDPQAARDDRAERRAGALHGSGRVRRARAHEAQELDRLLKKYPPPRE
jgi:hypothetical protein